MEPMDGQKGLESSITAKGTLTVDENTSYLTITQLPISQASSDIPSVLRVFREPVQVRAFVVTLRSAESTSVPSGTQESTTSRQPTPQEPVTVTVTLRVKKPGDNTFTDVIDDSTGRQKVTRQIPIFQDPMFNFFFHVANVSDHAESIPYSSAADKHQGQTR